MIKLHSLRLLFLILVGVVFLFALAVFSSFFPIEEKNKPENSHVLGWRSY